MFSRSVGHSSDTMGVIRSGGQMELQMAEIWERIT